MSEEIKDVKEEVKEEKVEVKSDSSSDEKEFSFEELTGMGEKKIPYNRFKEVNDEKKALKVELENMKTSVKQEIEEAILKEQVKAMANKPVDEFDDLLSEYPSKGNEDISGLKNEIKVLQDQLKNVADFTEQNALKQEINSLKKAFPSMNEEHVLTLKKMHKDASLEECAKFSHDQFLGHAKQVYEKMLEEKKAAKDSKLVTGAERIRNLKPEEKPKSLAEARAAMYKFMKE